MFTAKAVRRTAHSFGTLALALSFLTSQAPGQTTPRPSASAAQSKKEMEDLKREIRDLKKGQEAIQKELEDIKQLLLAKDAAPSRPSRPEKISTNARPSRGESSARLVVVEFSDYQCPYCGLFFRNTMPQLEQQYIKTGKIRYVFNNLPLAEIHPFAVKAAQAAECAGDQGKFWDLHDRLFSNQNALSPADLTKHASSVGLDLTRFNQCLASGKGTLTINTNLQEAESLGIEGTPAFVLAIVDRKNPADQNLKIVGVIGGAQPFPVFKQTIDKILAQQNP